MSDNESKPNETRVSANELLAALNRLHLDMSEMIGLIKTQNGLLGAVLKQGTGRSSKPPAPQITPQQAGYPSMSGGGSSHVPGELTGLEEPQWTGQKQSANNINPTPPAPLPMPNRNQPLPQRHG